MQEQPNPQYSFIVRCWRDERGRLRGRLIDALSGQAQAFTSTRQLSSLLERLTRPQPAASPPPSKPGECAG